MFLFLSMEYIPHKEVDPMKPLSCYSVGAASEEKHRHDKKIKCRGLRADYGAKGHRG